MLGRVERKPTRVESVQRICSRTGGLLSVYLFVCPFDHPVVIYSVSFFCPFLVRFWCFSMLRSPFFMPFLPIDSWERALGIGVVFTIFSDYYIFIII